MSFDLVAAWNIPVQAHFHKVEFDHGQTTGKRVIRVDGKEVLRRNWIVSLTGKEDFSIGNMKCSINIKPSPCATIDYEYVLEIEGNSFVKYKQDHYERNLTWEPSLMDQKGRVVFDKGNMTLWVNGSKVETVGEFTDAGTIHHFTVGTTPCRIVTTSSGDKKTGVIHDLYVRDYRVPRFREPISSTN
ncbi:hypothetical protein CAEBREN_04063 [Caenorhabditis brenneri]|uniref:Fas apoptotic inhibitory molecule 1 n=1 Tax=Caenorhabditis brenneri TaxID=135651 RepID=G0MH53_CAEBE|nr:hypothetical protein CAEBREN_04063 [Caenorhabditis brenneri]